MKCPHCQIDLLLSERMGIEIDYCPQCRGIWLDRGELDKILERSAQFEPNVNKQAQMPPQNPREFYNDDHSHHDGHHDDHSYSRDNSYYEKGRYKKKSFLSDLFEF